MKIAVLGSGSRGNATILMSGITGILIDAGLSSAQMVKRLAHLGIDPSSVSAIVVTHDHGDHSRGSGVFARKHGTPIYLTRATSTACEQLFRGTERLEYYAPGRSFTIGEFQVDPFLTVHDAVDPVGVTVTGTRCGTRVGIATDLGRPTEGIIHSLSGCHFLVLEANHDEEMLRTGPYPALVQARIVSSHGHLSNHAAAELARQLLHPQLSGIFLAHLSGKCNRPELARNAVRGILRKAGWRGFLEVATQDEPTRLVDIGELRLRGESRQLSLF